MILSELNRLLVNVASSNYLVNDAFVGDVYTINAKENKFGCFVATPMTAVKYVAGTIRYTYYLYYIDRLTKDEVNIDFVQSDAVSVLKGIIDFVGNNGVEIGDGYEFTLFREKFSDWCAGAYVNVTMIVPDNDCGEGDFNADGIDLRPLVVDRNGIYSPGSFDGYNRVTINVPQVGATESWVDDEIDLKLRPYGTKEWVEDWVEDQGFLTQHQSLDGYASKNWVGSQGYLKECNLDPYATKNWVLSKDYVEQSAIQDMATEHWVRQQNFLVQSDLDDYATEDWIRRQNFLVDSDLSNYATQAWVRQQNYLIDDDLCGYATESYVRNWVTAQEYVRQCDLAPYATKTWVENKGYITPEILEEELEPYATIQWVNTTLEDYATKQWVEDQDYGTKSWITEQDEAVKSWVLDQDYASKTYVQNEDNAVKTWVTNQDYGSKTWITEQDNAVKTWVSNNYVSNITIQDYATKSWTDSEIDLKLTGYATETWVQSQGYLTQHQDISGKVNYTDIWTGTRDEWEELTPEEQCSYLISLIVEE